MADTIKLMEAIRLLTQTIAALETGGFVSAARKLKLEREALERLVNN